MTEPPPSSADGLVRPARPDDVPVLVEMVRELAVFERASEAVLLTEELLAAALFSEDARASAHVVARGDDVVAMALWYVNFSTWTGRYGIYLEDLFVRSEHRRRGFGTALLKNLAAVAVERGYARLDWRVLDWNEPARSFYRSIGAVALEEWTTFRLQADGLARFAARA